MTAMEGVEDADADVDMEGSQEGLDRHDGPTLILFQANDKLEEGDNGKIEETGLFAGRFSDGPDD